MKSVVRLAVATAAGLAMLCGSASAATITPISTQDVPNNSFDDPGCTLRDAVQAANDNASDPNGCNGDTAGADTIILQGGQTYTLTNTFTHEDDNVWGDLDIADQTTITTNGGLATIEGKASGDKDRVIHVLSTAGAVTLKRLKITKGFLNDGEGGGGILAEDPLTVLDSEVSDNTVSSPNSSTIGGGIYAKGTSLTMTGSTVADNVMQATNQQVIGGGIGLFGAGSSLVLTNSTVSGNNVNGSSPTPGGTSGFVGGIFAGDFGNPAPATLTNATITGNSATNYGSSGGGLQQSSGTVTGSIIAGNTDSGGFFPDCYGGPQSGGGNVIGIFGPQAGDCQNWDGPNDVSGTPAAPLDADLGTLNNNGGLTRTHTLGPNSPAINRGGTCPATDQRGFFRGPVAPCDAGALELNAPASLPSVPTTTAAAGPTGLRDAALKKCKKKKGKKRKKCKKKALLLPV
jgi:CSLREA domain-containing protein